jgi:adenosyl cobinamide kinase/adenosyl cobinamide phosphate guanylyltransferase
VLTGVINHMGPAGERSHAANVAVNFAANDCWYRTAHARAQLHQSFRTAKWETARVAMLLQPVSVCACADASLILISCNTCLPDLPLSVTT